MDDYSDPLPSHHIAKKPKRVNHNELERKRRQQQKEYIDELRNSIPTLREEKPSAALVIQKASVYIAELRRRQDELEADNERLREYVTQLGGRPPTPVQLPPLAVSHSSVLGENSETSFSVMVARGGSNSIQGESRDVSGSQNGIGSSSGGAYHMSALDPVQAIESMYGSHYHSAMVVEGLHNPAAALYANPSVSAEEYEMTRKQNMHLKDRVDRMEMEIRRMSGGQEAGADSGAPGELDDLNGAGNELSPENLQAVAAAAALTQGWGYGGNRRMSLGIGGDGGTSEGIFRKRRSIVDADYDDMRRGYYQGRRNSTIMTLEQMQALSQQQPFGHDLPGNAFPLYSGKRTALPSALLPVLLPPLMHNPADMLGELAEEEVECVVCTHGLDIAPMLDCEKCHKWFHGDCVGVDLRNLPDAWACSSCTKLEAAA